MFNKTPPIEVNSHHRFQGQWLQDMETPSTAYMNKLILGKRELIDLAP